MSQKSNIPLVLFGSACAVLFSCGTPEKSAPAPSLINGAVATLVSPFDTLDVEFTENVVSISAEQVSSDIPVVVKGYSSSPAKKWMVFGDSTPTSKITYFLPDTTYTVSFADLENEDGEVQSKSQVLSFRTMPLLDCDFQPLENGQVKDNNDRQDADALADSVHFFNGQVMEKELVLAGFISGDTRSQLTDDVDWYTVFLSAKDTIEVELEGMTEDLDLVFQGPANNKGELYAGNDLMAKNSTGTSLESNQFVITLDVQDFGVDGDLDLISKPLQYWIGVRQGKDFKLQSPYVLKVLRK